MAYRKTLNAPKARGLPDDGGVPEAPEAPEPVIPSELSEPSEPSFTLAQLRRDCVALFGVSISSFDGATSKHRQDEYTISEARGMIDAWLSARI